MSRTDGPQSTGTLKPYIDPTPMFRSIGPKPTPTHKTVAFVAQVPMPRSGSLSSSRRAGRSSMRSSSGCKRCPTSPCSRPPTSFGQASEVAQLLGMGHVMPRNPKLLMSLVAILGAAAQVRSVNDCSLACLFRGSSQFFPYKPPAQEYTTGGLEVIYVPIAREWTLQWLEGCSITTLDTAALYIFMHVLRGIPSPVIGSFSGAASRSV